MSTSVYYSKDLGRYNWAGTDKEWCVHLQTPFGNISETWPEDDEPEIDGLLPSEVLDLIEARLDHYWINTGREQGKATIAAIREHAAEVDTAWLDKQIERAERELAELRDLRADVVEAEQP